VGTKAERRAANKRIAVYHEARLGELIEYVTAAIDRYPAGEIGAYTVDETIHRYHRAVRELWKFCWSDGGGTHSEVVAGVIIGWPPKEKPSTGGNGSRRDSGTDLGAPCRLRSDLTGLDPPSPRVSAKLQRPQRKWPGSKGPVRRTNAVSSADQGSDFRPVATHACLIEVTVVPKRSRRLAAA
jgi:hypothetical protein